MFLRSSKNRGIINKKMYAKRKKRIIEKYTGVFNNKFVITNKI